ncbi:hypothetical protein ACFRAQ_03430 [Nocardia sp. NPDC056611]|uniref:hypothetical protein n=1 Tax=Nocardia sp. NPDC056611 TaxID=3345877 RepID=UPI00366ACC86
MRTDTGTLFPNGSDGDRAEQSRYVCDTDRDIGLDTTALHPLAERVRAAFDAAAIADRCDQAWITPLDLDDDYTLSSHRFRNSATGWITRRDLADDYDWLAC